VSEHPPPPWCTYCGEVLGVYEPLVVLLPREAPRMITNAEVRRLPAHAIVLHADCHAGGEPGDTGGSAA